MKSVSTPLGLLGALLIAAPVIGGQLTVDGVPLLPGAGASISALLGGPEWPAGARAVLTLLAGLALVITLWRHKVVQTPPGWLSLSLGLFFGLLGFSVFFSEHRFVSSMAWFEWLAFGLTFFAVVAVAGRERGPKLLLAALVLGCTVVSLKGIAEYGQMRAIDPTWRIFADWINQNALAGMLMLGLFPALSLAATQERLAGLLSGLAATLILFAIVLTQSRGGYAGVLVGLVLYVPLVWAYGGAKKLPAALAPFLIAGLLFAGLQASIARQAPESTGVARVVQGTETQANSTAFRLLLYRGAVDLILSEPSGQGIGAYRFASAKPGLTTQTHLTHNTYLQLAVEASPLALAALLAFAAMWFRRVLSGAKSMAADRNLLRAGVVGAIVASGAHNVFDSDLYHFGIGIGFFALLALGLQLAADGGSPEALPATLRRGAATGVAVLVGGGALYFAAAEHARARVLGDLATQDLEGAQSGLEAYAGLAPADPEGWFLRSRYGADARMPEARLRNLERAVELGPVARYLRALAREQLAQGQVESAAESLRAVLRLDPNNLPALRQLLDLHDGNGDVAQAMETARRLIEVEQSPAFQVRAIPEMVPTATLEARVYIADRTDDPAEKAALLQTAFDGYEAFAITTVPLVRRAAQSVPPVDFAGESLPEAEAKLEAARRVAAELQDVYRELGEPTRADEVAERAAAFAASP